MKRQTNFLRSALVVAFCIGGMMTAYAQTEISKVVATGGETNNAISCTIGETFVGDKVGMWESASDIATGIDGIYSNGGVVVENVAANHSLKVKLSDEEIAKGAFCNVYTLNGMLLERNQIEDSSYILKYGHLLDAKCVVVTIRTSKGVVATYKLTK